MINYFNEKSIHSTDPKGRLLLPKDIRTRFKINKADVLYLLPSLSDPPYLEIRPVKQWESYCARLLEMSLREDEDAEQKKDSYRYAQMAKDTATVDGQGRILIPERVRASCGLNGDVAVINMDSYFEVWRREHMEKRYADIVRAFKKTNDRMF